MKKLLALVVSLLTLTLCFTGCGREKKDISGAKNIKDLNGAIIAAQTATFHLDALDQIDGVVKKDYKDFPLLLSALNSGAIDGYVAEEPTALAECMKDTTLAYLPFKNNSTGFTASDSDTGIAVAFKKGSPLKTQVDDIVKSVSSDVKEALMKQIVKMSADKDSQLNEEFALKSSKTGATKGTLTVAMECGYDPFNWTQTTSANGAVPIGNNLFANGYDVQFAKYVARELDLELVVDQKEWASLIPAVKAGTVDCIMAGMSPTAERIKEVDFTECYYTSNLVIIYKKQA